MSVRQYIGARYVTKIYENSLDPSSAEWEGGRAYEPLTLVTYLNSSYLSKKEVPASVGDPASNPAYWVVTGAYNGQIATLQNQIDDINQKIPALNNINMQNMAGRKFVFIGDSYTQVPTPATSSIGKCIAAMGLSASQYHNVGVSGTSMTTFINQVTGYSYPDADEITDVVVTGGINDAHVIMASSTLSTTIPQLLTAIKSKFPNAVIWAGFSGGGYYTNLVSDYAGFTYSNVQNIKYLWERWFSEDPKVIYMDHLDEWFRNLDDTDYYQTDGSGLHPNGFGIKTLGTKLANFLKGGSSISPDLTYGTEYNLACDLTYTTWTGTKKLSSERYESNQYVRLKSGKLDFSTPISLNSTAFHMFSQPNIGVNGIACMKQSSISCPITYTVSGDSTPKTVLAVFTLSDVYIDCYLPYISTINNVDSIIFPELEFIVPANAI